uniref:Uncharacterized protein n=1 Tax=Pipistrellus kuhlii TaxID=59472 RepID=A0A7J7UG57_PIPKU|nr:hypothetical protein mPipKuh1_009114 [Pipistrellus kuhlii]
MPRWIHRNVVVVITAFLKSALQIVFQKRTAPLGKDNAAALQLPGRPSTLTRGLPPPPALGEGRQRGQAGTGGRQVSEGSASSPLPVPPSRSQFSERQQAAGMSSRRLASARAHGPFGIAPR